MTFRIKSALLAASVVGFSTTAAMAVPGIVERDSNLRSGPGTNYRVQTVVPAGAPIEVLDCQSRWCTVAYGPTQGFIARSLIDLQASAAVGVGSPVVVAPSYGIPAYGYYGYGAYPYYSYHPTWRRNHYSPGVGFWFGF
jgi:uncharacterized protein YraI